MKRIMLILMLLPLAYACVEPVNKMIINESVQFCTGEYNLSEGVFITKSDVDLDCNGATLIGTHADNTIGIFAQEVANVQIHNCKISGYKSAVYLTRVEGSLVYDNFMHGNAYGIYLLETIESSFSGNEIFDNIFDGMALDMSVSNKIIKNRIYGNDHGIYSYANSTGNQYTDNAVWNNTFGIFVVQGYNNIIKDNTFEHNTKNGIHLVGTEDEHLENNLVRYNEWSGVVLDRTRSNIIVDNVISENQKTGIFIVNKSRDNIFTGNLVKRNWIYSAYLDKTAYNNSIFGNEFYGTDIKDITNATKNHYCKDDLMNRYYDGASGPGCLSAPIVEFVDTVVISDSAVQTILQGGRIDDMMTDIGLALIKLDVLKKLYLDTVAGMNLKKRLSVVEVFFNGTRQNHTRISLILEPNETMYNLSVYEKVPDDVRENEIDFSNKNYTKINDYVYLWNFSVLDTPVNLSYVIKKLINGEPITFPLAQRVGKKAKAIEPEVEPETPVAEVTRPETQIAEVIRPETPVEEVTRPEIEKPSVDNGFAGMILMIVGAILLLIIVIVFFFKQGLKHTGLPHHDKAEVMQMAGYVRGQLSRGVTMDNMRAYLMNLGYDKEYIEEIFNRLQ